MNDKRPTNITRGEAKMNKDKVEALKKRKKEMIDLKLALSNAFDIAGDIRDIDAWIPDTLRRMEDWCDKNIERLIADIEHAAETRIPSMLSMGLLVAAHKQICDEICDVTDCDRCLLKDVCDQLQDIATDYLEDTFPQPDDDDDEEEQDDD